MLVETEATFKRRLAIRASQEGIPRMSYFLDFEHVVRQRTPEVAFGQIESWLRDQKAQVKESRPPSRIVATHGRALQPLGWRKDARKTIAFELTAMNSDVTIKVRITPAALNASDVRMRSDEARANWNELLAELWVRFGESKAVAEAIQNPPVDWNASLARGKGTLLAGGILLVLGLATIVIFVYPSPVMWFGTGFIVTGVLSLMYGGMAVRSAKRRLAAQTRKPEM